MGVLDNLNKIGALKVIDAKFDRTLKIILVMVTLLGSGVAVLGEVYKAREATAAVPGIEKRLTILETTVMIELKNINLRLNSIDQKLEERK